MREVEGVHPKKKEEQVNRPKKKIIVLLISTPLRILNTTVLNFRKYALFRKLTDREITGHFMISINSHKICKNKYEWKTCEM